MAETGGRRHFFILYPPFSYLLPPLKTLTATTRPAHGATKETPKRMKTTVQFTHTHTHTDTRSLCSIFFFFQGKGSYNIIIFFFHDENADNAISVLFCKQR